MKKFKLTLLISAMVFSGALIYLTSCQKQQENQIQNNPIDEQSREVTQHILDFKAEMEYYRENPGLKSDYKKEIMQTILDWESTLNFDYCHSYVELSDMAKFDTVLWLPIEGDSIWMSDISERYYDAILLAVQTHFYVYQPFSSQRLMVVDLEPNDNYDSVYVSTYIGNDMPLFLPSYDWVYGESQGTCGENPLYFGESDAALQIAHYVRNIFAEEPPEGKRWSFPNPETILIDDPTKQDENNDYIYINTNDTDGMNNHFDYLIYYAHQDVTPGLTTEVMCIETTPEPDMDFYKQNYVDITQDLIDESNGKKFKDCFYYGKDKTTFLRHELETIIGFRFVTDIAVIELPPIEE